MKNSKNFVVFLGLAVIAVAAIMLLPGGSPKNEPAAVSTSFGEEVSELKIEDLKIGQGPEAAAGKAITAHYDGWLTDGTKFDSSRDRGQPLHFALGVGHVIPGWDQGLVGMKVGGVRRLTIPPSMAYGDSGQGPIPGNATLIFEVELLEVAGATGE